MNKSPFHQKSSGGFYSTSNPIIKALFGLLIFTVAFSGTAIARKHDSSGRRTFKIILSSKDLQYLPADLGDKLKPITPGELESNFETEGEPEYRQYFYLAYPELVNISKSGLTIEADSSTKGLHRITLPIRRLAQFYPRGEAILSMPFLETEYNDLSDREKRKMWERAGNIGGDLDQESSHKRYDLSFVLTFSIPESRVGKARLISRKVHVTESLRLDFRPYEAEPPTREVIELPRKTLSASGRRACQKILAKFPEWRDFLPSTK